jgi:hypothetical protein
VAEGKEAYCRAELGKQCVDKVSTDKANNYRRRT